MDNAKATWPPIDPNDLPPIYTQMRVPQDAVMSPENIIDRLRPIAEIVGEYDAAVAAALQRAEERLAALGIHPDLVGQDYPRPLAPLAIQAPAEIDAATEPVPGEIVPEPVAEPVRTTRKAVKSSAAADAAVAEDLICDVCKGPRSRWSKGLCKQCAIKRQIKDVKPAIAQRPCAGPGCGKMLAKWTIGALCRSCRMKNRTVRSEFSTAASNTVRKAKSSTENGARIGTGSGSAPDSLNMASNEASTTDCPIGHAVAPTTTSMADYLALPSRAIRSQADHTLLMAARSKGINSQRCHTSSEFAILWLPPDASHLSALAPFAPGETIPEGAQFVEAAERVAKVWFRVDANSGERTMIGRAQMEWAAPREQAAA